MTAPAMPINRSIGCRLGAILEKAAGLTVQRDKVKNKDREVSL